jgi:hypothetical protein
MQKHSGSGVGLFGVQFPMFLSVYKASLNPPRIPQFYPWIAGRHRRRTRKHRQKVEKRRQKLKKRSKTVKHDQKLKKRTKYEKHEMPQKLKKGSKS